MVQKLCFIGLPLFSCDGQSVGRSGCDLVNAAFGMRVQQIFLHCGRSDLAVFAKECSSLTQQYYARHLRRPPWTCAAAPIARFFTAPAQRTGRWKRRAARLSRSAAYISEMRSLWRKTVLAG